MFAEHLVASLTRVCTSWRQKCVHSNCLLTCLSICCSSGTDRAERSLALVLWFEPESVANRRPKAGAESNNMGARVRESMCKTTLSL